MTAYTYNTIRLLCDTSVNVHDVRTFERLAGIEHHDSGLGDNAYENSTLKGVNTPLTHPHQDDCNTRMDMR